jgi:predicted dienelactone hydrolase
VKSTKPSWIAIAGAAAFLLCSLAAWGQNQSIAPAGPYKVLTIARVVLHDSVRHKEIPLKIYYPDAPGPFPVIIFSHGALASKDAYFALGQYWASYGYVSIHPSHSDSIADSGYHGTLRQALSDPQAWRNRPQDISFVIDSLSYLESSVPQLAGKLDAYRIGVGGHSFGAYTASLIGGTTILLPGDDSPQSFADKRVSAVVLLSPQGEGVMGLAPHSWSSLHLPMLLMYGSRDFGPFGEPPVWRSEPFVKAPPGDKYEVEVAGATHMNFTGPVIVGGHPDEAFQSIQLESLAFWNAYLKHDPKASQYLTSHGLQPASQGADRFAIK